MIKPDLEKIIDSWFEDESWEGVPYYVIEAYKHSLLESRRIIEEYGRQMWNAAIEIAAENSEWNGNYVHPDVNMESILKHKI